MKKCPYCAELVQDDALICKHCRSDLPAAELLQRAKAQDASQQIGAIVGLIAMAFFLLVFVKPQCEQQAKALDELDKSAKDLQKETDDFKSKWGRGGTEWRK